MSDWVAAIEAFTALNKKTGRVDGSELCIRAHLGLIETQAEMLEVGKQKFAYAMIPCGFWWAEGAADLQKSWATNCFVTFIPAALCKYDSSGRPLEFGVAPGFSKDLQIRAVGVEFARAGLSTICPDLAHPTPAPDAKRADLSDANFARVIAGLKVIADSWSEERAARTLDAIYPDKRVTRDRLRAGLRRAGLAAAIGRPSNSLESGSAD